MPALYDHSFVWFWYSKSNIPRYFHPNLIFEKGLILWSPYIINHLEFCFYAFGKAIAINKSKRIPKYTDPKKCHLVFENCKNIKKVVIFSCFWQKRLSFCQCGKHFFLSCYATTFLRKLFCFEFFKYFIVVFLKEVCAASLLTVMQANQVLLLLSCDTYFHFQFLNILLL